LIHQRAYAVLSTALYQCFSSRGEADYQDKLLSAMRFQFGGHLENRRSKKWIMSASSSDAMVFFGAPGDLAYKKIFPSLQAMLKSGNLNVPIIGAANAEGGGGHAELRQDESRGSMEYGLGPVL
jgi:hypothetical protein